jgi:DNA-damage-inducible protein J
MKGRAIKMANVNIRVDDALKQEAERIFSALGLSMSTATNVFYKQVVRYGGIPFDLRVGGNQQNERSTLEKAFESYSGEPPEPYDWGEMDAPAGRELV